MNEDQSSPGAHVQSGKCGWAQRPLPSPSTAAGARAGGHSRQAGQTDASLGPQGSRLS